MQYLYIDESGSMTIDHFNDWPYFVIAIVRCGNPDKLKTLYKRFIKKHILIFYNYSSYFSNLQISSFCKKTKAGVQPIGRTEKLYSRFA